MVRSPSCWGVRRYSFMRAVSIDTQSTGLGSRSAKGGGLHQAHVLKGLPLRVAFVLRHLAQRFAELRDEVVRPLLFTALVENPLDVLLLQLRVVLPEQEGQNLERSF